MFMIFLGGVGIRTMNNKLDFGTAPDLYMDPGLIFPLFKHWKIGHFLTSSILLRKCGLFDEIFSRKSGVRIINYNLKCEMPRSN